MRYLLDVDGVICDFISSYLELVNRVTGRAHTIADITDFEFKSLGLTDHDRGQIEALMFQPGWVRSLSALPGAYDGLRLLRSRGHDLVFVTSPWRGHPTWAFEREQWLLERFPDCKIIHTNHKRYVSGHVLIDDKPEHVNSWMLANPIGIGVLWDAPYNRVPGEVGFGIRMRSWADVAGMGAT
jgi:5'(3')-deoxyribonucleotidase